jgi:hypothetical protein
VLYKQVANWLIKIISMKSTLAVLAFATIAMSQELEQTSIPTAELSETRRGGEKKDRSERGDGEEKEARKDKGDRSEKKGDKSEKKDRSERD